MLKRIAVSDVHISRQIMLSYRSFFMQTLMSVPAFRVNMAVHAWIWWPRIGVTVLTATRTRIVKQVTDPKYRGDRRHVYYTQYIVHDISPDYVS